MKKTYSKPTTTSFSLFTEDSVMMQWSNNPTSGSEACSTKRNGWNSEGWTDTEIAEED